MASEGGFGSDWPQRALISGASFKHIVDAVTNALLQWTIELKKRGIKGEDMNFDENEKQSAAKQVFNIGTVHGIVGNATNSQVNIHIANSVNELKVQVSAISEIERALATAMRRGNTDGEALARAKEAENSLRKAREELEDEAKPDPNRVLKWLEQAKYALKAFGLTKEIIDAGQKLEEAFHLSDWLGSVVS
jgi:DNA repair exonuclease SbcCD ATPase subunit